MSRDRATSTLLDVALFLLCVGAAVGLLAVDAGERGPPETEAPAVVTTLSTSTETVDYRDPGGVESRAHATLAGHVAAATVLESPVTPDLPGYRAGTETAVENATAAMDVPVAVTATWRPYPGAEVARLEVGPEPPADADVDVATATVASGYPAVEPVDDTDRAVAAAHASALVEGRTDPHRTRSHAVAATEGGAGLDAEYEALAGSAGVVHDPEALAAEPDAYHAALTTALATRIEAELATAETDDRAGSIETVRITVRTWSR